MRRLIIPFAAAALVAACYDNPSAPPSSLLTPRSALRDGLPPPPPATGEDGFADFSASPATDAEIDCSVSHDTFGFAYEYLNNSQNTNAYLHIRVDGNGLDVAVHETTKKITATGTLTRPTYTFQINDVVDGTTLPIQDVGAPPRVLLRFLGQLTLADGTTCLAVGTFSGQLGKTQDVPPPVP